MLRCEARAFPVGRAIILCGNQVRTRRLGPYGTCITFAQYTFDGTVCMVIQSCLWSNGEGLVLQFFWPCKTKVFVTLDGEKKKRSNETIP